MHRALSQAPVVLLGIAALGIPFLVLQPAWTDIVGKARASVQKVQLESVRVQATHLSHQLETLQQLAAYLAEDPSELGLRIWSPVVAQTGLSEGVHIYAADAEGRPLLDTLPGRTCVGGGFPVQEGMRTCDAPPLRVAITAVARTGERITVMQETAGLSPMLQSPWAWVVDQGGNIVAHADPAQVGTRPFASDQGSPELRDMLHRMALGESGTATYGWTSAGTTDTRLAAYAPVPGAPHGWSIATSTSSDAAVGPLQGARSRLGIAGLAILGIGFAFSMLLLWSERHRRQTERRQAAERLRLSQAAAHSERLALIGTLTAGVAHDIRSPLTAMVTIGDLLEEADDEERAELLTDLRDAVHTMRAIADDLTGFSRGDAAASGCPEQAIDLAVRLVRARFRSRRDLVVDVGAMPPVSLDSRRLSQAIMNLCVNAVQAGAETVHLTGTSVEGQCVITVEDDGPGVPEELRARVFDAFLTTKAEGKGTGLGLYLVRSFIEDSGGTVDLVHSRLGGAAFRIILPPAAAETAETPHSQGIAAR